MELKQLAPWNWFKKEQDEYSKRVPALGDNGRDTYPASLARVHDAFDRLFEDMLGDFARGFPTRSGMIEPVNGGWMRPLVDISATDKAYTIAAELPGVDENKVHIDIYGDTLRIRGEKSQEKESKDKNYHCIERSYGSFQRQLSLPEDADSENIDAKFRKGVLTITVPRTGNATSSPRRIEVNAA